MILEHYQRMYEIYCNYSIFLYRPLRVDKMNSYRRYLMAFATSYYLIATNQQHKDHVLEEIRYGAIFTMALIYAFFPCWKTLQIFRHNRFEVNVRALDKKFRL